MKTSLLLSVGAFLVSATSFAQSTLGQINSTVGDINNATYSATNATNAVRNTTTTIKGIGAMLKKKEKPIEAVKEVATNAIIITITGIDYAKLKLTEDYIKSIEGVKSTVKKFNTGGSTIEVTYTGKDDQLWDALPENIKAQFNLTDLGNGKITLDQQK